MSAELDLDLIEDRALVSYGCSWYTAQALIDEVRRLRAEVERYAASVDVKRAIAKENGLISTVIARTVERDELRAVLAPLLDDTGEIGAPCFFCRTIIETGPHDPDCPVLARDRLLGRAA